MNSTQELIARGICIAKGRMLLAYLRAEDYYFLPGGHVEFGEPVRSTLRRELEEEIGVTASVGKVVQVHEHQWTSKTTTHHEINFLTLFEVPSDLELKSKVPHLDFVWMDRARFNTCSFEPDVLRPSILELWDSKPIPSFFSTIKQPRSRAGETGEGE